MNEHNRDAKNLAIYDALVTKTHYNWDGYDFFLEYIGARIKEYCTKVSMFDGYVKSRIDNNNDILFLFESSSSKYRKTAKTVTDKVTFINLEKLKN